MTAPERTRRKRLAKQWQEYRERVIPADAGVGQVVETRRAFYAGAAVLFGIILGNVSPSSADVVEESDLEMMDDLDHELTEFLADAKAGRGVAMRDLGK